MFYFGLSKTNPGLFKVRWICFLSFQRCCLHFWMQTRILFWKISRNFFFQLCHQRRIHKKITFQWVLRFQREGPENCFLKHQSWTWLWKSPFWNQLSNLAVQLRSGPQTSMALFCVKPSSLWIKNVSPSCPLFFCETLFSWVEENGIMCQT